MDLMAKHFLEYEVDDPRRPTRITTIRGVRLPEGVLYTPLDVPVSGRILSRDAIETAEAIVDSADDDRNSAGNLDG